MADLSALKTRIASELHHSNLTSEIADAITSAIAQHRSRRFEVNQLQASFNTVASQEAYTTSTIPDDIGQIDTLRITVSGNRYLLDPIGLAELQTLSTTTTLIGRPTRYAFYAQQIYLNPIPDGIYAVLVSYLQRKDAPSGDSDGTTIWTNQCEALIRACAKKLICRDVIYDADGYARNRDAEAEALGILMRESMQLQDEGGLQPN